jgi:hypothetical protein
MAGTRPEAFGSHSYSLLQADPQGGTLSTVPGVHEERMQPERSSSTKWKLKCPGAHSLVRASHNVFSNVKNANQINPLVCTLYIWTTAPGEKQRKNPEFYSCHLFYKARFRNMKMTVLKISEM